MRGETTDVMNEEMRRLASKIEQEPGVKTAHVDDWGYYGNFSILVTPENPDRHTTRRIKSIIKNLLSGTAAHLRNIFPPDTVYESSYEYDHRRSTRKAVGYSRDFWSCDLDYMNYDATNNSFN